MDRGPDHHLQRIIEYTTGHDRPEQAFSYSSMDGHPPEYRRPVEDHMLLNDFVMGPDEASFGYDSSLQPSNTGPTRLSLAPRNIYNRHDNEPRLVTNADNHFRFAQNLRRGLPVNPAPLRTNNFNSLPAQSPISQLATNMVLHRQMPRPSREDVTPFLGIQMNRLNELQPRRQEITPPFNLSGFVYGPNAQQDPSSSPPFAHPSSPTTRVSLRRTANRAAPSSNVPRVEHDFEYDYDESTVQPETPPHQTMGSVKSHQTYTPQALALGHAPPMAHGIQLVSPHELPDRFRQVFTYELFNAVQSKCFAPIYKSNYNVVVSAPTGSGKTALLELAICKLVADHPSGQFKIVYQAPTKSLCSERMRDWQKKFSHLNLPCAELTGDTGYNELNKVATASIIVTTPEKWDSITRKWTDHKKLVELVKLFLIDEVHILKDTRGATLEAVVSRMKSMGADVRFVALSATVPNSQDIAIWLGRDHTNNHRPAHRETFGEDFRPVKLQKHVYGFDGSMNDFAFEKVLDGKLPNLIQKHTRKKPIMVFCFTRKSCENTAMMLAEWWTRQRVADRAWPAPAQKLVVGSKELQDLVGCGVAFHHAGLDLQDRNTIENAFLRGDVSLICCTSTLAMGVNLPCHLVVLKGTVGFQDGSLCEYSDLEAMQMLGRAGRPQFDDSAVAVILTRSDKADRYKKMISGQDIIESTLHLHLIEHLNSEIGLGTIYNVDTAKKWLNETFLSVRMRRNPDYYKLDGIPPGRDADARLGLVCERDVKLLQGSQLVNNTDRLACTEYGQAMSRYMVQFETMKLLLSLPSHARTEQILLLLCQASEFKDLRMKPNQRSSLREFNKSPFIKYPIKENISTTAHKISLMIQVQLGGVEMPNDKDFLVIRRQFLVETSVIFERIQRLIRCIIDCKAFDCDAISTRHALDLARSLAAKFWENSNLQLRQVSQVGPVAVRKLVTNNINSVEKLTALDTSTIERLVGKNPPFGRKILDSLVGFPVLTLACEIVGRAVSKAGQSPKVNVNVRLGFSNTKIPVWGNKRPALTFMAESSDGTLVHFWRDSISKLVDGCDLKFVVQLSGPDDEIKCSIACDEIVGTLQSYKLKPDIPAAVFPVLKTQQPSTKEGKAIDDEFGIDSIEDNDFLAVVTEAEAPESDYGTNEFEDIEDFDDIAIAGGMKVEIEPSDPVKMENGKWTCNHHCRGGAVLKNGKPCKHKCCHEGLDKPRKRKPSISNRELLFPAKTQSKSSKPGNQMKKSDSTKRGSYARETTLRAPGTNSQAMGTNPRKMSFNTDAKRSKKRVSQTQLKLFMHNNSDQQDVEVVDLSDELSPVPYSKLAPLEYRKLHELHTNVQKDITDAHVRLPKQKPHFSYASGIEPDLPFLRNANVENNYDMFDSGASIQADDFPSPSALLRGEDNISDPFESGNITYQEDSPTSSFPGDSLESIEVGMLNKGDEPMIHRVSTPKINSSFANGVFDFDAFDEKHHKPKVYSSPLMKQSRKRERSLSPEISEGKHRRIAKDEPKTSLPMKDVGRDETLVSPELPKLKCRRVKKQEQVENTQQITQERQVLPDWVSEFDADLIQGLMGFVDFVD